MHKIRNGRDFYFLAYEGGMIPPEYATGICRHNPHLLDLFLSAGQKASQLLSRNAFSERLNHSWLQILQVNCLLNHTQYCRIVS